MKQPVRGSTAWYKEMDQRLQVATRYVRSFTPWKKEIDDHHHLIYYSYPITFAALSELFTKPLEDTPDHFTYNEFKFPRHQ